MSKKWGHDELAADLAEYLRTTKGVLAWEDMQLGPSGSPRPDVYTMNKSFARFTPIAYECKISMADFRRDVTAGKWQSYLPYSSAVVFASPAGLLQKGDIPNGCGLIVRHDEVWRLAKGPTLAAIDQLPRNAWIKLFIDGIDRQVKLQRVSDRTSFIDSYSTSQALRKKYGDDTAELIAKALRAKAALQAAIELDISTRKEINDGTDRYAKMHRESVERQLSNLSSEQRHLAVSLGLKDDATVRELTGAIRRAQQRLGKDDEVTRLRRFFSKVKEFSETALEPLPGMSQDD